MSTRRGFANRRPLKNTCIVGSVSLFLVGVVLICWRNSRAELMVRNDLRELFACAVIAANASNSGDVVASVDELVAAELLSPDRAARIQQNIELVPGLNLVSASSLPLAHSKETFWGKFLVVEASGKILRMTGEDLGREINRVTTQSIIYPE
jgi:hypothetical protein